MSMAQNGLAKLSEECAEVVQVAQKMVQYPSLQTDPERMHPDGVTNIDKLERELGDALAAISFVQDKLKLNKLRIIKMQHAKLTKFWKWDAEPENHGDFDGQ